MELASLLSPFMLLALVLVAGLWLGWAALMQPVNDNTMVDQVNALLPQTQCGQCGHPGCKPYAQAIAAGGPINKCPPGGAATIRALATLLGVAVAPLDPAHGVESARKLAYIREDECIGCTKCIQACPVDAILGSAKHMHTVIVSECTGCDLCVEPCPVDCIDMIAAQTPLQYWPWPRPEERSVNVACIATDRGQGVNA
jgi:electron transport complex protein RnfB